MPLTEALAMAVCTDPGKLRSHNEDAVFCDAALGLAILADGMGGYNAGEVASSMATTLLADTIIRTLENCEPQEFDPSGLRVAHRQLRERIEAANAEIYFAAHEQPQFAGMGTTLVVAWFYDNQLTVAHLGDSRLYRLREGQLERLTRDHSYLQEQLDSGMMSIEQARVSNHRNLVTRALGVDLRVSPELQDFDVRVEDLYLLCSDGLSDMVDDEGIGRLLQAFGSDPTVLADQLVQMANDNGGRDNVSVIVTKVRGAFPARAGWWQKLLSRFG